MTSGNLQKKVTSDEYVPSAPPFFSPAAEIKELMNGSLPLEQLICNLWQNIVVSQLRTTVTESGGRQCIVPVALGARV
ncbi:hypothetical protein T459_05076 [Capsicum annuum]|uniref:Uncharacterized protein n=1 Tax=Capsicum annuum TaxID=4072 RepID=A0A2G3A6Z4_CAPAN|nr:hypothetical protein T459_05076 [Capsicum annuum]